MPKRVILVIDFLSDSLGETLRQEYALDPRENRTGDIWHILLETEQLEFVYGYRIQGPSDYSSTGHAYAPRNILIDPFCHNLQARKWGDEAIYGFRTLL